MNNNYITFMFDSLIPFVLRVPFNEQDVPMVKSVNAPIELVGVCSTMPPIESSELNIITSRLMDDLGTGRQATIDLIWKGGVDLKWMETIDKLFRLHIVDIHKALKSKNSDKIEHSLSQVIVILYMADCDIKSKSFWK